MATVTIDAENQWTDWVRLTRASAMKPAVMCLGDTWTGSTVSIQYKKPGDADAAAVTAKTFDHSDITNRLLVMDRVDLLVRAGVATGDYTASDDITITIL